MSGLQDPAICAPIFIRAGYVEPAHGRSHQMQYNLQLDLKKTSMKGFVVGMNRVRDK